MLHLLRDHAEGSGADGPTVHPQFSLAVHHALASGETDVPQLPEGRLIEGDKGSKKR